MCEILAAGIKLEISKTPEQISRGWKGRSQELSTDNYIRYHIKIYKIPR